VSFLEGTYANYITWYPDGPAYTATIGNATAFESFSFSPNNNGVWTIGTAQAVPEPSTYCMALAGLACGGYTMFRRRRAR
jgi:hypothetical protein